MLDKDYDRKELEKVATSESVTRVKINFNDSEFEPDIMDVLILEVAEKFYWTIGHDGCFNDHCYGPFSTKKSALENAAR